MFNLYVVFDIGSFLYFWFLIGECCFDGVDYIVGFDFFIWRVIIEWVYVDDVMFGVENEKFRCIDGVIVFGWLLWFVEDIGKVKVFFFGVNCYCV